MQKNLKCVLVLALWLGLVGPAWSEHDAGSGTDVKDEQAPPPQVVVETDRSVECIQSICKPAEGVSYARQKLKKELNKLVARIGTNSVDYSDTFKTLALSIEEKIKAKNKLESTLLGKPFDPESKAIDNDVNTLLNMSMMMAMSRGLVLNSEFKLDIPASRKAMLEQKYSEEVVDWIIPAANFYLTPELSTHNYKSRSLPATQYLTEFYGGESAGAKAILQNYQEFLKELKKRKSNLATVLEWQAHAPGAEAVLEKATKGEALRASEIQMLPRVDVLVRSARRALDEASPLRGDYKILGTDEPQGFHFDLQTIVKNLGGPEGVATRITKQLVDRQLASLRALETCKTNYIYQREIYPTIEQVAALHTVKQSAKDQLKARVLARFSEHSRKMLSEMIGKTELYSPPARSEAEERFKNALSRAEASLVESIGFLQKLDGIKADNFRDVISALATVQPIATSAESFCADVIMDDFSDAMVHQEGIQLGPALAMMDAESQSAGIAHELSHAISARFRQGTTVSLVSGNSYRKLKMCVRDMHPKEISPRISETAGRAEFTSGELAEEDLADWISGQVIGKTKVNAWCHVMEASADGDGWAPASTTPAEGDHHSGNLFRLIHHEQMRGGEVGEACRAVLTKSHGSGTIKSCKI